MSVREHRLRQLAHDRCLQLLEEAQKLAGDQSPFDYGPDPRHVAAAAAAVASMVRR